VDLSEAMNVTVETDSYFFHFSAKAGGSDYDVNFELFAEIDGEV